MQVTTLQRLRHRNIVQYYGACIEPDCLGIVTGVQAPYALRSAVCPSLGQAAPQQGRPQQCACMYPVHTGPQKGPTARATPAV